MNHSSVCHYKDMPSPVLHRVTLATKKVTCTSSNGVGGICCMDLWDRKRKESFNLSFKKINNGNPRVSIREHISSPLVNVEKKKMLLPEKVEDETAKEVVSSDGIGIIKFIRGRVFLITGGTGFLAKVLIEKILRSVPDVGKIYLLVKADDNGAALQRIQKEIINTELFKSLQQIHGKSHEKFLMSKLVPVVGNVCDTNLGMEVGLANRIAKEVDIIINSAGNTTFDERFDVSLNTNTLAPCRFLGFAKRCKKLMLFLHVSTAYVNGERQGIIVEKPFCKGDSIARERATSVSSLWSSPLLDVETELKMAMEARGDSENHTVSQRLKDLGRKRARIHGWQDTYVFSKAMAEMMIESEREDIPVVIIRPSIIESTYREPIPGWIEGIRMVDPLLLSYGKGELTGFPVDGKAVIDTVPADMVVNAILAATVKYARMKKPGLNVYHVASSVVNPLTFGDMFSYFFEYFASSPYIDLKKRPVHIQTMKFFSSVSDFTSHIQTEAVQRSSNAPPGMDLSRRNQKLMDHLTHLANIYWPYTFYGGRFDNSNTQNLLEEMSQEEKMSFGFDVKNIDWKDYICNIHIPGIFRNVLKGRGMQ